MPLFANAACTNPSGSEGHVIYNSTAKMLQFCNGTVWVNAAGVAPGAGGGGGLDASTAEFVQHQDSCSSVCGCTVTCNATCSAGKVVLYASNGVLTSTTNVRDVGENSSCNSNTAYCDARAVCIGNAS